MSADVRARIDAALAVGQWVSSGPGFEPDSIDYPKYEASTEFADMSNVEFADMWRSMTPEDKAKLPAEVRKAAVERYNADNVLGSRKPHSIDRATATVDAHRQATEDAPVPAQPFAYVSLADLSENPPPEREWVWRPWFPRGTLVAGFGGAGIGKTLFAQQVGTCVGNGVPIFGQPVTQGPVIGLFGEDDPEELRRRQGDILAHLGRSPSYSSEGLHFEGRAGLENVLMTFGADRVPLYTPLMQQVHDECARLRPALVILDNIAQMFGGLENDRHQVTVFANALTGIAREFNCCVLLLGHVAKAEGSEYSGSTAWEAAVRTRLWLERRVDGLVELHRAKANYAARDSVLLEYQHGAFVQIDATSAATDSLVMAQAEIDLLAALDTLTARQVATSQAPTATTFLPKLAGKENLLNGTTVEVAARALAGLIDRGELLVGQPLGWKKADRHPAIGIARKVAT